MLSTITVANTDDTGTGTLRAAIEQADLDSGQQSIVFAPSVTGTINLLSVLPDLSGNINIDGPGSSDLTVARSSGPGRADFRIFNVPVGAVIAISGLTITGGSVTVAGSDGNASGGGIENSGTLSLNDVTISGNTAGADLQVPGDGGGIDNSGMLSIDNATIRNNSAIVVSVFRVTGEGGFGGGIYNTGTLSIMDTTCTGNGGDFGSGGIENTGTLLVVDSVFAGNNGGELGAGAIGNSGNSTVTGSTFTDNRGFDGGGGIKNSGTLTVANSTFSGNMAFNSVGGGVINSGTMSITTTTFSSNSSQGGGGAIGNSGSMSVTASTFTGNSAVSATIFLRFPNPGDGGAIDNSGTLSLINTTLKGNSANGGSGGAIADSGTLSLNFVTIDGNSASGHKRTGGVAIMEGTNTKVETIDSIFDNRKGGNISGGTRLNFQSLGHNLFSDRPRVRLKSDLVNTNPRLGRLADHGGPTLTQILLRGSRAIDAGVPIATVSTDQRGFARSQRAATDIGAVEVHSVPRR